jgi:hypothetical protein
MRKIEKQMIQAIYDRKAWKSGNTIVSPIDGVNSAVFLHGNHIADVNSTNGSVMVVTHTLRAYPTVTTKSRLRALGANVSTRKGVTYLDNVAI